MLLFVLQHMRLQRITHQTLNKSIEGGLWRIKQKAERLPRLFAFKLHSQKSDQCRTRITVIRANPIHVYGFYQKTQQKSLQSFNNGEQENTKSP